MRSRKNDGEEVQNSEFANGLGKYEAAKAPSASARAAQREPGVEPTLDRRVARLVQQDADEAAGEDESGPREDREVGEPRPRTQVAFDGSGSTASIEVARTGGVRNVSASVASANATRRPRVVFIAPHSAAAAMIAGPMMLRMSTLSSDRHASPAHDHRLQAEEERETEDLQAALDHRAGRGLSGSSPRRILDPADSATDTPARKRNSGAPNPPRIIDQP